MAKKFQFDDDKDIQNEYQETSRIDDFEEMKDHDLSETKEYTTEYLNDLKEEDIQPMSKKKKKFKWRWWYYLLIIFTVLIVAFSVYIFVLSSNEGPVYGSRCENIEVIPNDFKTATIETMKKKYPEIKDLTFEIACKQLKVDITYQEKMTTKKAQKIAEETVQTLDGMVGKTKEKGKTYSQLFGKINNNSQYEVNLYLHSENSEDFPIYGTKHVQNDKFSYTLASVKDKKSQQAAQETLKDKK